MSRKLSHVSLGETKGELSGLWVWNSGSVRDNYKLEDSEDELDWDSCRQLQVSDDEDNDDRICSDRDKEILNDQDSSKRKISGREGGDDRSEDRSIGTLSYDDDIVAKFDDDTHADTVAKAVLNALERAHRRFSMERKSKATETTASRRLSINQKTALADQIVSERRLSDMLSVDEKESKSERIGKNDTSAEDLTDGVEITSITCDSSVYSDYSIALEDKPSPTRNVTTGKSDVSGYTFESVNKQMVLPKDSDSIIEISLDTDDDSLILVGDDDVFSFASSGVVSYGVTSLTSSNGSFTLELRKPLHATISGLTTSDIALPCDDCDMNLQSKISKHMTKSSQENPINETTIRRSRKETDKRLARSPDQWSKVIAKPRMSMIAASAMNPRLYNSLSAINADLEADGAKLGRKSMHDSYSSFQEINKASWIKVVPEKDEFRQTHAKKGFSWWNIKEKKEEELNNLETKIPSRKVEKSSETLETNTPLQSPRSKSNKRSSPETRMIEKDTDVSSHSLKGSKPSGTKKQKQKRKSTNSKPNEMKVKEKKEKSNESAKIHKKDSKERQSAKKKRDSSAHKKSEDKGRDSSRRKNRENLEKLNSKMNATIGVQMSPGSLGKKKKRLSLSERRKAMAASREKLRESFDSALSKPPLV